MDDIVYSNNPNEDSAQVKVENKFHKASLVRSVGDSEVIYQDNVNVDKVLFTGEDGKKHTASLTKDIGNAEVIYENNPNIGKVLFTGEDGKKHTATLVKNIDGGSAPVIDELNVTPSTSAQTITAPEGTGGYSPVNVAAVTSSIDANIVAGNIKDGVEILGVTGNYTGSAPAYYIEKTVVNGKLISSTNIINLNGVTDIGDYGLANDYYQINFPANTSIDLSSLTTLSGRNACQAMFQSCTGLTSVDLSGLTTISGAFACQVMFAGCAGLTSIDLSSLTTISGANACQTMFQSCTGLTSVNLSSLTTISGAFACQTMFQSCTALTSVDLSGLTTLNSGACQTMFLGCTSLATVYIGGTTAIDFRTYTNQFQNMFRNCTQNIDVYAPAANKTQIEAFSGYPNFDGTGTVTWHWRS